MCANSGNTDLEVHIFCPYSGILKGVFETITYELRKDGYCVCTCAEEDACPQLVYPDFPNDLSKKEENWLASKKCLETADTAVFCFLEAKDNRVVRPSTTLVELNSSVVRELSYWLDALDRDKDKTYVLFEGDVANDLGSLIEGNVRVAGLENDDFASEDYTELFEFIRSQCRIWTERYS